MSLFIGAGVPYDTDPWEAYNLKKENAKLRELAQRADRLLTGLFPYIDYSRCTALEAVAAWRVRARELGIEVG